MKTFFRHFRFGAFAVAILCMALGSALLLWPDLSQKVFCYAFGGTLTLCGVFQIASYLVGGQKGLLQKLMFAGGVISAVAGVWILLAPDGVLPLTAVVMGIVLLYHGVMDVKYGFDIKQSGGKCGAAIIFGLLCCAVGVLLLVNPFGDDMKLLFMICGAGFLFDGLTDLYTVTAVATAQRRCELAAVPDAPILDAGEKREAVPAAAESAPAEETPAAESAGEESDHG